MDEIKTFKNKGEDGAIPLNANNINETIQAIIGKISNQIPENGISLDDIKNYISDGTLINELVGLGTICKTISGGGDWNTSCDNRTGFYMGPSMVHSPNNSIDWHFVINLSHNELYARQIAFNFFHQRIYTRYMSSGTWYDWEYIGPANQNVLWWSDTTGTASYPSFSNSGYKYIEIIMYHSGHNIIKSSGKILFNQVNGLYFSFHDVGSTSEYYSRVYITDSACAINANWEKTLGGSSWKSGDSWKIRGVIGYY